jgi:cell division protein FtsZ
MPFKIYRQDNVASKALEELKAVVDTYHPINNDRLKDTADNSLSLSSAMERINSISYQAVKSITDIITQKGYVNTDFADIRMVMKGKGFALMGIGQASGPDRAKNALEQARQGPLWLDVDISGAFGIILNTTSNDLTIGEANLINSLVKGVAGDRTEIFSGFGFNDGRTDGSVTVTLIATGLNSVLEDSENIEKSDAAEKKSEIVCNPVSKRPIGIQKQVSWPLDEEDLRDYEEIPAHLRRSMMVKELDDQDEPERSGVACKPKKPKY